MENQTFNYKDDRFSIRPQAPPGGESHFNISDSGYGDRNIYHPHKRNNHPNNDINPPPNHVKKENVVENTSNGAAPVTGNRPSIKLRAPPGGKSSLDYYSSEDNYKPSTTTPLTKNETVYAEPEKKESMSENNSKTEPQTEQNGRKGSHSNSSSPFFNSNNSQSNYRPVYTPQAPPGGKDSISLGTSTVEKPKLNNHSNFNKSSINSEEENKPYKPYYAPQAPPGGKSSISFGYDEPETKFKPKPKPNPEFQESPVKNQPTTTPGRRMNARNNQLSSSIFNSEDENKPYKPYYAPQAPPGGKDSISLGTSTNEKPKQNNQSNFNKSTINYEEENKPYKPYYAPQAPPGGKDSISFGNSEPADTNISFSGRRRNYKNDHFKSSFSFNY